MVVLLNGAFGIGKTTVARALRRRVSLSVVFDPEKIGFVIGRLPLAGSNAGDYQNMPLWRRLTVRAIRLARIGREHVIVPMAFSDLEILKEIRDGVARFEPEVRHYCLVAPIETVRERLSRRGSNPVDHAWEFRRAQECCEAHVRPEFAEQIATTGRSIDAIVDDLVRRIVS